MRAFSWVKHRIQHKFEHYSLEKLKKFLKENGLAFVIIFLLWEVIEDVLFPILFSILGAYVHPAFYAGIPVAWLLCLHWLAVPLMWAAWIKIKRKKDEQEPAS
jgi:uncharacterized membrane protein